MSSSDLNDDILHRVTGRVLPVDPLGRVLLLHGWDPAHPQRRFWFSVGGSIENAETVREAAARELHEECGIVLSEKTLGEPIAVEDNTFDWGQHHIVQTETYFAVPIDAEPDLSGLDEIEQETIDGAGWWSPDELDADGSAANPMLTRLMRRAVSAVAAR